MSWAEIKKAVNSNLDVPLNDYMQCKKLGRFGTIVPQDVSPGVTCTLFEYDGKMLLQHLYYPIIFGSPYTFTIKISIDGEDVYKRSFGSAATGMDTIYIFYGKPLNIVLNSSNGIYGIVYRIQQLGDVSATTVFRQDFSNFVQASLVQNYVLGEILPTRVLINSNMKVTIENNGTQTLSTRSSYNSYYCAYGIPLD